MAWPFTPLTTYVVGTVVPPTDLNSIESAINGIFGATQTLKALQVDGVGANTAAVAAGNIVASGVISSAWLQATSSLSGTSLPNTSFPKASLGFDCVLSAWCVVNGSTGALRGRAMNIASVTRNSTGVYTIGFNWSSTNATDIAPSVTCIGTIAQLVTVQQLSTSSVKVFVNGAFGGGTPQDSDFFLGVIAGT